MANPAAFLNALRAAAEFDRLHQDGALGREPLGRLVGQGVPMLFVAALAIKLDELERRRETVRIPVEALAQIGDDRLGEHPVAHDRGLFLRQRRQMTIDHAGRQPGLARAVLGESRRRGAPMGLGARPVLLRLGREREDPGLLGLGQFPEASLEGDDAVGDLRQQIEAGVPDVGGRKGRRLPRQEGEELARPAAFGVEEAGQHRWAVRRRAEPFEREGPLRRARLIEPPDDLGRLSRQRRLGGEAQRPERRGLRHAVDEPASLRRIVDDEAFHDQPHGPERRARRDGGDERLDLVGGLLSRQRGERLARRIGGRDPFDARGRVAVARGERNRTGEEHRRRQLGQKAPLARLQSVGSDMLQPLGQRLVELALADEAGDQEQRLLDRAVQRRRVAENDLGLLEQPLGEQRLGPAEVSVGESVPPLRPGLLLEELLVELDGLLESAETQRLLGLRSGRAGHGREGKLARVRSGHAASFCPRLRRCRPIDASRPPLIPTRDRAQDPCASASPRLWVATIC